MTQRKRQLEKIVALIEGNDASHQSTLKLVKYVTDFDWKLSALGFFVVDRRLLGGVRANLIDCFLQFKKLNISYLGTRYYNDLTPSKYYFDMFHRWLRLQ